ncbi:MAG: DRTGG domain-containing protein [Desulfobacterales bacterium]|nr:DRTGG domain-containing protein [Desulfobacterales bacterium]
MRATHERYGCRRVSTPRAASGPAAAVSLADVRAAVNGAVLWCPDDSLAVTGVVAADLMSDVLVDARPGCVLVTGLVNVQVIRTAAIADLAAVVFARGKSVPADIVDLAREMNVPVFASRGVALRGGGPALRRPRRGGPAAAGARRRA